MQLSCLNVEVILVVGNVNVLIARTIIANPRLLVMDEATSALDYNTERQLCESTEVG